MSQKMRKMNNSILCCAMQSLIYIFYCKFKKRHPHKAEIPLFNRFIADIIANHIIDETLNNANRYVIPIHQAILLLKHRNRQLFHGGGDAKRKPCAFPCGTTAGKLAGD